MSLFSFRRNINEPTPQKECGLKNFLAYRDTWQEIPSENFSMQRIIFRARYEKYKQLQQVKLVRTENGFRRKAKDELSTEDVFLRMVQASLNKLTEANYQTIVPSILVPEVIKNPNVLAGVVNLVFLKAVAEPVFSGLYARLIEDIDLFEDSLEIADSPSDVKNEENGESVVGADGSVSPGSMYGSINSFPAATTFGDAISTHNTATSAAAPVKQKRSLVRKELVRRCQKFFDLFVKGEDVSDEEEKELMLKKNRANIKFSGELFMRSCVSERVITSVCDIVLFVPKEKLTDANVEMAISLLRVVGQKFDDSGKDSPKDERSPVWQRLAEIFTEKTVSQRIRFLIQNLLELRDNKWQPRAAGSLAPPSTTLTTVAATVRAVANTNGEKQNPVESGVPTNKNNWGGNVCYTNNNNSNTNANNRFPKGTSNAVGAGTGGVGGKQPYLSNSSTGKSHSRVGEHGESQKHSHSSSPPHSTSMNAMGSNSEILDLSGGGAGTNMSASLSSAPFSPHSEGSFGEITAEDKKMLALASLPPAFTPDIEKSFLSAVRDAVADGDWDAAAKTMKEKMKDQNVPEHTGAMCGAYTVVRHVASCTDPSERQSFIDVLTKCPCFDQSAVSRGFAWFFAHAIAKGLKDDYPLWHTRVNDALMSVKSMPFSLVLRDVFARSGNYLGALCALDEMCIEQQEELMNVWSAWCKGWKTAHLNKEEGESEGAEEGTAAEEGEMPQEKAAEESDPMEVLDMLREVKQRPFLRDIMPDCLSDLLNEGFVTVDAVRQFVQKIEETPTNAKKVTEAAKVLSKQLTELIGDGEAVTEE